MLHDYIRNITRRHFFAAGPHARSAAAALGVAARARAPGPRAATKTGIGAALPETHFPAKAKHVIYLHMVGGPPQMDLYDYKPKMSEWYDKDLPDSVRKGQRLTTMTSGQARFPIAPSKYKFAQHGKCGMWVSRAAAVHGQDGRRHVLHPQHAHRGDQPRAGHHLHADRQPGHRPAVPRRVGVATASARSTRTCRRSSSWSPSRRNTEQVQAISARLWQSGYLPGEHAGVSFRAAGDPILYINNPPGVPADVRRKTLDGLKALNEMNYQQVGDPETHTRIQQYEMAFRMQSSVPELTDLVEGAGDDLRALRRRTAKKPGTFANTALLARRLVERGVRFVQIYHNNWDTHANVAGRLPDQCRDVDQPCYGLIQDLKQRGHVRRDAGHLGRRVRPDDLLARAA